MGQAGFSYDFFFFPLNRIFEPSSNLSTGALPCPSSLALPEDHAPFPGRLISGWTSPRTFLTSPFHKVPIIDPDIHMSLIILTPPLFSVSDLKYFPTTVTSPRSPFSPFPVFVVTKGESFYPVLLSPPSF